jgi:NAD(P)-dependent dehydrogenase (short-subunit alcohol dehydrogenase family)
MDLQLVDKRTVVTGTTAGIGFAIAEALAKSIVAQDNADTEDTSEILRRIWRDGAIDGGTYQVIVIDDEYRGSDCGRHSHASTLTGRVR